MAEDQARTPEPGGTPLGGAAAPGAMPAGAAAQAQQFPTDYSALSTVYTNFCRVSIGCSN